MDPLERVCRLEGNHLLLDSLVVVVLKVEVSAGVGIVHEVELGEDTVGIVGFMSNRISTRAGGNREETILNLNHLLSLNMI